MGAALVAAAVGSETAAKCGTGTAEENKQKKGLTTWQDNTWIGGTKWTDLLAKKSDFTSATNAAGRHTAATAKLTEALAIHAALISTSPKPMAKIIDAAKGDDGWKACLGTCDGLKTEVENELKKYLAGDNLTATAKKIKDYYFKGTNNANDACRVAGDFADGSDAEHKICREDFPKMIDALKDPFDRVTKVLTDLKACLAVNWDKELKKTDRCNKDKECFKNKYKTSANMDSTMRSAVPLFGLIMAPTLVFAM